MNAREFVAKWRGNRSNERQSYQQFFLDLCALAGHPTPKAYDPTGTLFTFEAGVQKTTGGQGYADVWFKEHFAIEFKGPHGDLEKAYLQLLNYREALDNPPLLIVSDTQRLVIHPNFTNHSSTPLVLTLDQIETPQGLQAVRNLFYNVEAFRPGKTAAQVTEEAAAEFAKLADHLRRVSGPGSISGPGSMSGLADRGYAPQAVAHYLIRLLFILFAEDVGLLDRGLFTRLVERGRRDPATFNRQMRQLFHAMHEGDVFGETKVLWFNGGLFDDDTIIEMDADALAILHGVTAMDWAAMEPSIMGTLFTRSLDPARRAQLGAHYTSRDDILLIVEPVLMAPLRREWAQVQEQARALAQKRDAAATTAARSRAQNELRQLLHGFAERVRSVRVLDPACGSGNFLYVSLRLLLDLDKEVSHFAGAITGQPFFTGVGPRQLYGIEKDEYAHELAQASVWIGYLQWQHENAAGQPQEPLLQAMDNIRRMDAILDYDAEGRPVEPEWPAADVIVGNPPFLGGGRIRSELGHKYTEDLFRLYGDRLPNFSDLVCYWFEKARAKIAAGVVRRVGLLATNSIRGGANRIVLERIKQSGDIFLAWGDRDWVLEGASVRVSMIGYDDGSEVERTLDGMAVRSINPDLTQTLDLTVAVPLGENRSICFMGPSPKAPFDIDNATAEQMLAAGDNPNGRSNSDVIRPVASGIDLVRRPRGLWTIDFGLRNQDEAAGYILPYQHVLQHVYPIRSKNRRASYAERWWQYAEARPGMRAALLGKPRFIATPEVAKYRVFVWLAENVLSNQQTLVFARDDDYFFGVLHARPHELWALRLGTSLADRPRYTPTTTFETYPFPWPPGKEPQDDPRVQAVAEAARELVALRDAWLNPPGLPEGELKKRTLTNLYNQRPDWLQQAHARLDRAVFAAYGWPDGLSDEEILERLLALNRARAAPPP